MMLLSRKLKRIISALPIFLFSLFFLAACGFSFELTRNSDETVPVTVDEPISLFGGGLLTAKSSGYLSQPHVKFDVFSEKVEAKGIYVTANTAGISDSFNKRLEFISQTELNAIVVDVKDDFGNVTFKNKIPIADNLGVSINYIPNIEKLVSTLLERDIYPIARIVVFKDNAIHKTHPEFVTLLNDGSPYFEKDANGNPLFCWLNPYNRDIWEYVLDIAVEAAKLGFKEIQFDYVRFPTDSNSKNADYGDTGGLSKIEIIAEFGRYAMERLKPYGVLVSADIFGTVIISGLDASIIGQDFTELAQIFDILCPMIYPSHYADNTLGVAYPDLNPYDIIYRTLELANRKLDEKNITKRAVIRPWLQDFTASWLKNYAIYKGSQIQEQVQACYDNGVTEWLFWDPSNRYNGLTEYLRYDP